MRKTLLVALGAAGLATISCSDDASLLGPDDSAEAVAAWDEMRLVRPAAGQTVRAAASFLVSVEQQIVYGPVHGIGVVEVTAGRADWLTIAEFPWSGQEANFSVEVTAHLESGPFLLRVGVLDRRDRSHIFTTQPVELFNIGNTRREAPFDSDRPDVTSLPATCTEASGGDAYRVPRESIADLVGGGDDMRLIPRELVQDDEYPIAPDSREKALADGAGGGEDMDLDRREAVLDDDHPDALYHRRQVVDSE